MKKRVLAALTAIAISGCAYQMQLMPRDSGTIYSGHVQSNGMGSGTLDVQLDGRACRGNFVTATNGDSFGFFQMYGGRDGSSFGSYQSYGSSTYKALLSCSDGTGLRCDVQGSDMTSTGAGICVDSNGRVFDMMYSPS